MNIENVGNLWSRVS